MQFSEYNIFSLGLNMKIGYRGPLSELREDQILNFMRSTSSLVLLRGNSKISILTELTGWRKQHENLVKLGSPDVPAATSAMGLIILCCRTCWKENKGNHNALTKQQNEDQWWIFNPIYNASS